MSIKSIVQQLINAGIEKNEAKYEVKMLLEHFCQYTEIDKIKGKSLSQNDLDLIKNKVQFRIETKTPVQYIIGKSYFMGNFFKVTPDVLIPRDETEILVKKAIELINKNEIKEVLDIGTGSGCIACTIAKHTNAVVLGTDISSDALRIALDNVTELNINNRAVFRKSDIYSKIREDERFGIIISNPPYIPKSEILHKEVLHEPQIALFAEDEGLFFYKQIIKDAPRYLRTGGYIMFELGINQAEKVKELLLEKFTDIKIEKDLSGIERIIYAVLK